MSFTSSLIFSLSRSLLLVWMDPYFEISKTERNDKCTPDFSNTFQSSTNEPTENDSIHHSNNYLSHPEYKHLILRPKFKELNWKLTRKYAIVCCHRHAVIFMGSSPEYSFIDWDLPVSKQEQYVYDFFIVPLINWQRIGWEKSDWNWIAKTTSWNARHFTCTTQSKSIGTNIVDMINILHYKGMM